MKLMIVTYQFQFRERVQGILEECELVNYTLHTKVAGHDSDGRHEDSQIFPGSLDQVFALMEDDRVDETLTRLRDFRKERDAHEHLRAAVLPVEDVISD